MGRQSMEGRTNDGVWVESELDEQLQNVSCHRRNAVLAGESACCAAPVATDVHLGCPPRARGREHVGN